MASSLGPDEHRDHAAGRGEVPGALWEAYKRTGERKLRDQLIVSYAPLVKYVAGRVSAGLPQSVEEGDLVSYGIFGLIDAIERFDPARGVKFETYAITRIKGAIIDELRSVDWVPRSVRAKARSVEAAYAKLQVELGRAPTDAEVAEELGMAEAELQEVFTQISFAGIAALDEVLPRRGDGDEVVTLGDTLASPDEGPTAALEVEEMRRLLARAIGRLGERERAVLSLYYYEGLTLGQIGRILGVSESRVSQIHTKSVLQLRGCLAVLERESA